MLLTRDKQPEIMDQPGLEIAQHENALRGLGRINWISGAALSLWQPIRQMALERHGQPLRVLDIATGGGDTPIRLQAWADRAGLPIAFAGTDINGTALDFARRQAARRDVNVRFFPFDALRGELPSGFDIITCSLFLHHLENHQAVDLLRRMGRAGSVVLVNDLLRSNVGLALAWMGTRLLSASPVVHHDGPQSVRAAFTAGEMRSLAEQAGLTGASVAWRWPFRCLLQWRRP